MNYLPSKELLSEILKEYKFPFSYEYNTYNDYTKKIYFYVNSELKIDFFSINIYELAHMCKEKAYTNKYRLSSGQHRLNTKQEYYINNQIASYFCSVYYITNDDSDIQIDANTEPEAILRAYQWTIDNRS